MALKNLENKMAAQIFRDILNENFQDNQTTANGKAPISHADSTGKYGMASTAQFGHAKVTNGNGLSISGGVISMGAGNTSNKGAVKLRGSYGTTSENRDAAATVELVKTVADNGVSVFASQSAPSSSSGKELDIWVQF